MKNVLLTTTALVAFAGAATAADVAMNWSGDAFLEYSFDEEDFDYDASLDMDLVVTQELNNGATATLTLSGFADFDGEEWNESGSTVDFVPSYVLELTTSYGSISYGDIENVNNNAFGELAGMAVDVDGTQNDGSDDDDSEDISFADFTHEIRAESSVAGFAIAASTDDDGDNLSANVTGTAGGFDFGVYVESNTGGDNLTGATLSGAFGGVGIDLAFVSTDDDESSMGIAVSYDVSDAVSVAASHAVNNPGDDQQTAVGIAYAANGITANLDYDVDDQSYDIEATYTTEISAGTTVVVGVDYDGADFGGSVDITHVAGDLTVYAGANMAEEIYAGAVYDLGGGASAYGYYADGADLGLKNGQTTLRLVYPSHSKPNGLDSFREGGQVARPFLF